MRKTILLHCIIPVFFLLIANTVLAQQNFYVNDNSLAGDVYTSAIGNNTNPGTPSSPFATMNYAISQAQAGDIIWVDAGSYTENVVINKSVVLKGAKAGIDPGASLDRGSETIVRTAINDVTNGTVFSANATNITMDGFLIDGDNPSISGGVSFNGADLNAGFGVFNQQQLVDGFQLKNNIIRNFNRYGVFLQRNGQPTVTENNSVTRNHFDNIANRGVGMFNNAYASVTENYLTKVNNGIFFANSTMNSSLPIIVDNNYIEAFVTNILVQSALTNVSVSVSSNTLNRADLALSGTGLSLAFVTSSGNVAVNNNIVSNKAQAINVSNITASGTVSINNNAITNAGSSGMNISTINSQTATVINGSSVSTCSGVGLFLIGGNESFALSNVTLTNCSVGIDASSSAPTMQLSFSNVSITGGTTGIRFYGSNLYLPGNALTGVSFSGQTKEYILQTANSFNGQIIDVSGVSFDGITPLNMTLAQLFATEDKLTHKIDFNDVGYFKLRPNRVYVTPNSFAATLPPVFGVATTFPDINRAVGCANANDTIYIAAGTYACQVFINKGITLLGEGAGNTIINPGVATPATLPNLPAGVLYSASAIGNVNIKNLTINSGNSLGNQYYGISLQTGGIISGCEINGASTSSNNGNGIYIQKDDSDPETIYILNNNLHHIAFLAIKINVPHIVVYCSNNTIDVTGSGFGMGLVAGGEPHFIDGLDFIGNKIIGVTGFGVKVNCNNANVTISNNSFQAGTNEFYTTPFIQNTGTYPINATCNWFGSASLETVQSRIQGNSVSYAPWLSNGTDNDSTLGFQPLQNVCNGRQNKFYVNDNSQTGDILTTAIGNNSNSGLSTAPFASFEYAYSVAQAGDTIYMDAGNYPMADYILDKAITVLGPNYLISPNDVNDKRLLNASRNAEAIISGVWFTIASNNITLKGLTFSPGAKSAFSLLNTAATNNNFGKFAFEKNILKTNAPGSTQMNFTGIFVTSPNKPQTSGYALTDNRFEKNDAGGGTTVQFSYIKNISITENAFVVTGSTPRTQNISSFGGSGVTDSIIFSGNTVDRGNTVVNGPRIANAIFANNKIYNSGTTMNFVNSIAEASNIEVKGNYFETTSGGSPFVQYNRSGGGFAGSSSRFKAENNTFVATSNGTTGQLFSSFIVTINNSVLDPVIILKGNKIAYSGDFSMIQDVFVRPITLRGNIANATVETNAINFNNTSGILIPAGGALPSNPGITINPELGTGAFIPSNAIINIINNKIDGFKQSFVTWDGATGTGALNSYLGYGNLTAGAVVNINNNSFTNDSISINNGTVGQPVNATCNWHGSPAYQMVNGKVLNTLFPTWLTNGTDNDAATGFQPVPGSCDGTPAVITLNNATDITCSGANNGSITITVSGGKAPYVIQWNKDDEPFSNSEDLTNLSPGTYSVTVTDAYGSTASITDIIISEPLLLTAAPNGTNVNCFGGANGSASVTAEGGTASYSYLWNNGSTTESISGLIAGTYTVTITDANGCSVNAGYEVTQPALLTATATPTSTSCFNSILVAASGGTNPYTYLWSNGATTASISSIAAGTYSVTITDANGCTVTASATVTANEAFNPSASVTDASCYGSSTGSIIVTNVNAVAPFQYSIDGGLHYQSNANFGGLAAGTYTITVKDANGCTGFVTKTINQPAQLVVSLTSVQNTCFGQNAGSISVNVVGGTAGYTYSWTGANSFVSAQKNISGLATGDYTLTVTDSKGCVALFSQAVNTTNEITVTPTVIPIACKGETNGSISLNVSGGSGNGFNYVWNTGATSSTISNLGVGNYNVSITDIGTGCFVSHSYTITQPASLVNLSTTKTNATGCASLGTITATGSGGTTGYQYKLDNGTYQTSGLFKDLYAGTYTVWVKDGNGCTKSSIVSITDNGSDEYEGNNSKNQAKPINTGMDVFARIAITTDAADWFRFTTTISGNYTITLIHPTSSFTFNLYPGNSTTALQPVSTNAGAKSYTLAANTTYYVSITGGLSYQCYKLNVMAPQALPLNSRQTQINEVSKDLFEVKVFGNPSHSLFNIAVNSTTNERITVRVVDVTGRVIEKLEGLSVFQNIRFGRNYGNGVYFAEVRQGSKIKTVRLVKL